MLPLSLNCTRAVVITADDDNDKAGDRSGDDAGEVEPLESAVEADSVKDGAHSMTDFADGSKRETATLLLALLLSVVDHWGDSADG